MAPYYLKDSRRSLSIFSNLLEVYGGRITRSLLPLRLLFILRSMNQSLQLFKLQCRAVWLLSLFRVLSQGPGHIAYISLQMSVSGSYRAFENSFGCENLVSAIDGKRCNLNFCFGNLDLVFEFVFWKFGRKFI